jgi:hypothetical protein
MRFKLLFVLLALAIKSFAANPYIPFSVDFEKSGDDRQFDIQSRVLSTPTLRFYTFQGANVFDPSAYVSTFSFAEDWNATNMVKITGTNYSSYVEFAVTSNTFAYPIDKWYASVLLTKPADGGTFAWAYGYISIKPSPEANANAVFFYTRAINGSEYGPFTGSFTNWPFALAGDYGGYVSVLSWNATNLLFEGRIRTNELDIANIKLTNSIVQSNLTAETSRATNSESVISNMVVVETSRAINVEAVISNAYIAAISAETSRATNVETIISNTFASAFTNQSNTNAEFAERIVLGEVANSWGNHALFGYLSAFTNLFTSITVADRSQLGANISGLTQGVYTGSLTTVSYTGVTELLVGRTYACGYTKIGAGGTSTLSIASHTLTATAAGATSNHFSFTGADTNLVLKLDGDGMSLCNVSNVYVRQITNGSMSVAEDLLIGGKAIANTIVLANSGEQVLNEGGTITPASNIKVNNTNGTVIALGNPQIATSGVLYGTVMYLRGATGTGGIQFVNGNGVATDCELGFLLKPEDVMQFVFLGGKWTEVKRVDR